VRHHGGADLDRACTQHRIEAIGRRRQRCDAGPGLGMSSVRRAIIDTTSALSMYVAACVPTDWNRREAPLTLN
jgi:hypothetical protein